MQSRTAFRLNYVKLSGKPGADGRDLGKYAMDFMEHAGVLYIERLRKILIFARALTVRVAFSVPAHVHHAWFEQRIQIMSQLSIVHMMELNRIILLLDRLMFAHQFNL